MRFVHHLATAAAVTAVTVAAPAARAADDPLFGFSVDTYGAPIWDRSITNQ